MNRKNMFRLALFVIIMAVMLGSFCAMMGNGGAVVFIVCWMVVGAALMFGWIVGVIMGGSEAKQVWTQKVLDRLEAYRIVPVCTKESASWNAALVRAADVVHRLGEGKR